MSHNDSDLLTQVLINLKSIIDASQTSHVQKDRPINWKAYKVYVDNGEVYIKRSLCDRCEKVELPDSQLVERMLKVKEDDISEVHLLSGLCRPCIQTKDYDKYLDGKMLTRKEAGDAWVQYLKDYESAWEHVLRTTKVVPMTELEWLKTCSYFNGCAVCGGPIQVRGMFFTAKRGGAYTPWNVIPLCEDCARNGSFSRKREYSKQKASKAEGVMVFRPNIIFASIDRFYKAKTIRVFLLNKMRQHEVNIDPILPYVKRFRENKKLNLDIMG